MPSSIGWEERSAEPVLQHQRGRSGGGGGHVRVVVSPGHIRLAMRSWSTVGDVKARLREQKLASAVRHDWVRLFHGQDELQNSQCLIELVPSTHSSRRTRSKGGTAVLGSSKSSRSIQLTLKVQNPNDFASGSYVAAWGVEASSLGPAAERCGPSPFP